MHQWRQTRSSSSSSWLVMRRDSESSRRLVATRLQLAIECRRFRQCRCLQASTRWRGNSCRQDVHQSQPVTVGKTFLHTRSCHLSFAYWTASCCLLRRQAVNKRIPAVAHLTTTQCIVLTNTHDLFHSNIGQITANCIGNYSHHHYRSIERFHKAPHHLFCIRSVHAPSVMHRFVPVTRSFLVITRTPAIANGSRVWSCSRYWGQVIGIQGHSRSLLLDIISY